MAPRKKGRVEVDKRLLFINSSSSVLAKILSISVLVWIQQYFLRRISSDEYALLPLVMSVMAIVPLFTLALTAGIGRYVTAAYDEDDDGKVTSIVSTIFPILLVGSAILATLGGVTVYFLDQILRIPPHLVGDAKLMLGMLLAVAVVRMPLAPFGVGFQVTQRFVLYNIIDVSTELLRIALVVALVVGVSPRVLWTVVAEVSSESLMLLVTRVLSVRMLPSLRFDRRAIDWSMARELTSFGAWKLVIRSAQTVRQSIDPIVLNWLSTAHDLACFHIGTMVVRQLQTIGNNAMQTSLPQLTALHVRGDAEGLERSFLRGNRYAMWLTTGISYPLVVFAHPVIELYAGSKFSLAAQVMILSLISIPLRYSSSMTPRLAHATAELRPYGLRLVVNQLANVGLTLFFVGPLGLGALGSIGATLVVATMIQPLQVVPLGIRMSGATTREWLFESLFKGLVPCLAAAPLLFGLGRLVEPTSWSRVGLMTACSTVVYLAVVVAVATPDERADARSALRAVIERANRLRRKLA